MFFFAYVVFALFVSVYGELFPDNFIEFEGSCPTVKPYGEAKHYKTLYTVYTYGSDTSYRCVRGNFQEKAENASDINFIRYDSEGNRHEFSVRSKQKSNGVYEACFRDENGEKVHREVILLTEDDGSILGYGCVSLENGKSAEGASIFSTERTVPEAVVAKFSNYLKESGSQLKSPAIISQENCPKES